MTASQALAFLKNVADDSSLAESVRKAGLDGVASVAKGAGYDCSLEEIQTVISQVRGDAVKLSDDMLDAVAGGVNNADLLSFLDDMSSLDDLF